MIAVLLMMLLLLMKMMRMLLMMLGRPCAPVRSFISSAPVQPPIPGVTRSSGAAVTSRRVNGSWGAVWSRVEGAGGHREALMLIQRMVGVMQMMMMVSGFRHRITAGPRSVTDGVFHKRVHVVHVDRRRWG